MHLRKWAGILGATAVAAGAFGAHGMKDLVTPERLLVWETAARYHLIHGLVLFALTLLPPASDSSARYATWAARTFILGILLFSGTLYALVLLDMPILGAVTPLGGASLIAGWLLLALIPMHRSPP